MSADIAYSPHNIVFGLYLYGLSQPPVDFTGYERFLPLNYFKFTDDDIFTSATSHLFSYPLLEGQELIKTTLTTTEICTDLPPAPVFGHLPNGDWIIWSPIIQLEDNGPSVNTPPEDMKHDTLIDGGGSAVLETGGHLKCANVARSFVNEETCKLSNFNSACSSTQTAETNVTGGVIVCGSVGEGTWFGLALICCLG